MISSETNTSCGPVTIEQLQRNLRLPAGYDNELLEDILKGAVDYVERYCSVAVTNKDMTATFTLPMKQYGLKYQTGEITKVTVNGIDKVADDYVLYNKGNPGVLKLKNNIDYGDVLEVEYTVIGVWENDSINSAIIAYASAMYNQPEGLNELDLRFVNRRLDTISRWY